MFAKPLKVKGWLLPDCTAVFVVALISGVGVFDVNRSPRLDGVGPLGRSVR